MNPRTRIGRRALLKALGVGPALLPLLPSEPARGACLASGPKRALFVLCPNGSVPGNNRAQWPEPSDAPTLGPVLAPFEPHKRDMLFFDRFRYQFLDDTPNTSGLTKNGHNCMQGLLTGAPYAVFGRDDNAHMAGGISLDQHIGQALQARGYGGMPSLVLGVRRMGTTHVSWKAAKVPVPANGDPFHVFDTLFGGSTMAAGPDPALERLRKAKKSLLDHVGRELERFSRTRGSDDRDKIAAHLAGVRELERRLAAPAMAGTCARPQLPAKIDVKSEKNLATVLTLQLDLMHAAMAADVARVGVIHLSDAGGDENYQQAAPWLGLSRSWHAVSHNDFTGNGDKAKIDVWLYTQLAGFIARWKTEREGERSMFDNAVIAFMSNMSTGDHEYRSVPMWLAGSAGGHFRTGRSIKTNGGPHNPLLVSIANAMDVPTTSFGAAAYNSGEFPGLRA